MKKGSKGAISSCDKAVYSALFSVLFPTCLSLTSHKHSHLTACVNKGLSHMLLHATQTTRICNKTEKENDWVQFKK